ncbi:MAG: hypothetical protein RLZZ174_1613 [Pseudomonadota bacterium]
MTPPPLSDRAAWAARLEAFAQQQRDALTQAAGSDAPVTLDQSRVGRLSRIDALAGQALAQATRQRREAALAAVASAQQRLASGRFGLCEDCEEPIALARLAHNPIVRQCLACAQAAES